jgi:endonuclease YncB( thermonuclease family)
MVRTRALNCSNKVFAGYERYLPEASPDIQASYQQAQAVAREQKFGLWSDPIPVPPWDWRKGEKEHSRMAHDAV